MWLLVVWAIELAVWLQNREITGGALMVVSQAAKVGAQIVVMGTVGRTGVKARLMGNTAEKVLGHLKTDVLAIKPA